MKSIKVFASATVANVGAAFDVLGFAVDQPGDIVTLKLSDRPGVSIKEIIGDNGNMCRGEQLVYFAKKHSLPILTIESITELL